MLAAFFSVFLTYPGELAADAGMRAFSTDKCEQDARALNPPAPMGRGFGRGATKRSKTKTQRHLARDSERSCGAVLMKCVFVIAHMNQVPAAAAVGPNNKHTTS